MAIAFDTTASKLQNSVLDHTWSISASATMLVVGLMNGNGSWSVSSITFGGQAMTAGGSYTISAGGLSGWKVYIYYLGNPPTGSQQLLVDSGGTSGGGIYMVASSYTGTGSTMEASHEDSSTSSTVTNTVTTLTNNAWCVSVVSPNSNGAGLPTANAGCTRRILDGSDGVISIFDSAAAITPAGSTSFVYNTPAAGGRGIIFSMPPPAVGPANVKTINGLAIASAKTFNGLAIGSAKTINGLN